MDYSCGFLFRETGTEVLLILKQRPDWQRGRFNGVGGKMEPGETPMACMEREFMQEAGSYVETGWREFCALKFRGGIVHFFVGYMTPGMAEPKTMTDEKVEWVDAEQVHSLFNAGGLIQNLIWLLPLALDKDKCFAEVVDPS